ncbi:MAG: SDR family oxidoreductase [Chloroflexi bacterium]|nr:SDR family oxidoreductase [Chloroflexota bacterium]MCI0801322.1 SDR family oxidoreductase [Chloroflexota bacterium]MCI0811233.1 SDR family oxidoreductase [Chloroflexota bacterium]MCI0897732.1 SDR family oxidoreductase [Chloroflexota bacterium]MCI0900771.1 SDR family oxidoreductase [Chloroflexota bacterium]
MPDSLNNKITLVTGAGSGIGRATSLVLAREGATVVVADIDADGGEQTLSAIKDMGGEGMFVHADVSRAADVEAMVDAAVNAYGRLDCAYNNAGIEGYYGGRLHEYPEDTFDRLMDINVKGVWLCLKYEIPQMLKQGSGAIVNTASVAGLVGSRRLSVYSASKHAVIGLTKSAALEYASDGIRVNAVCPGIIDTPMMDRLVEGRDDYAAAIPTRQPIGRKGTPDEIAEAVAWLCSDAASLVTGLAMAVDGAFTAQ